MKTDPENQAAPTLDAAIASLRAAYAGRAGTGARKRRGDADYYRALASKRKNPGRKSRSGG